jgi:hypothetical protein
MLPAYKTNFQNMQTEKQDRNSNVVTLHMFHNSHRQSSFHIAFRQKAYLNISQS